MSHDAFFSSSQIGEDGKQRVCYQRLAYKKLKNNETKLAEKVIFQKIIGRKEKRYEKNGNAI